MGRKTPVGVTLYTVWESGMEVGEPEYIIYTVISETTIQV